MTTHDLEKYRQDIHFDTELNGHQLQFTSTWGLFSPRNIDEGTLLLLKYLEVDPDSDCLDIGCGYGPIGLTMARMAPNGKTLMVDKDFIAIEYSNKNIKQNNIHNVEAQLSNGFNHIPKDRTYDVIASNIPAKVGKELLTLMLHDARDRLDANGRFYVVTVNGLRQFMKRYMTEIFGNYKKLKQGKNYTVACTVKTP